MDVNEEALRRHYQKLPDEDIERLAKYEANDLSPEAQNILKEEIRRRDLSDELEIVVDIQIRGIPEGELKELIRKLSMFPCPICGRTDNYLNAFSTMTVISFILLTRHEKSLLIACPNCVSAKAKKTLIISLLLGWWGFPWGPIKTIQSIFTNSKALRSANYCEPTLEFIEFIKPHAAVIKAGIEKIKDLKELYNVIDAGKI